MKGMWSLSFEHAGVFDLRMPMNTRTTALLPLVLIILVGPVARCQQSNPTSDDRKTFSSRTRALDEADSRAEKEAERLVSLSPERIILLLQQEPGLSLEVKKMLVRRAYAQGRVLSANELTDDAIFRLVREDEETRALITKQIVDRGYVRAKPTREELARQFNEQEKLAATRPRDLNSRDEETGSDQTDYAPQPLPGGTRNNPYQPNTPFQNSPQSTPQTPIQTDQTRTLLQANANGEDSVPTGLPFDAVTGGDQQQLTPEQVQQLVTAYGGQASTGGQPDVNRLAAALGNGTQGMAGATSQNRGVQLPQSQEEAYARTQAALQTQQLTASYAVPEQRRSYTRNRAPSDQPRLVRRANPYADVPSLYDLYSQYSRSSGPLKRFGLDIFVNGTGNFDQLPMDLPAGPDYVLGPGDGLNIDLWGSVSQRIHRTVDREGKLSLPEIGSILVAGHTLAETQQMVQSSLRSQFRTLDADVSLDRIRVIRVYVVGDVQRPGAYDISSLSTPLNALFQAGGPTTRGSMRIVKHYRGNQLVEDVDLYSLLLHGVHSGVQRLESGDTILIPPIGQQVTLEGMVRRPGIYELSREKNLTEVLELAGGVLSSGTLRHIDVERVQAHENRTMLRVDMPDTNDVASVSQTLDNFSVQDGDKIKISPILPFSEKTVYLDGHVFRPGKYAYRDGMKITDLVRNYRDVLPEPYEQHAEIIRLTSPDLKPEIIAFSLKDALGGGNEDVALKPFDTVRVFGRFDFEDPPVITVTGEVRDPGDHVTNGATYLRDAVFLAGNTTTDAELNNVQIFRKVPGGKLEVLSADLQKAITGDPKENMLLQPQDRVFIYKSVQRIEPATVEIQGDVPRPGKYPLGANMTATQLVKVAGGLKRSAYAETAELTRYSLVQGQSVEGEHIPIKVGQALNGEPDTDMRLHAGDVLTITQITGWKDIGATITVDGQVVHPGTYGIQNGEHLSDVIARAGGLLADAYPYGAIFERVEIRELAEKNRAQLIEQAKGEGGALGGPLEGAAVREASVAQWRDTVQKLETTPPIGRMVIHISSGKDWVGTANDVQLRDGDSVYIPKKPNFVMVEGAVYNQTAIAFRSGKSASWYLYQSGGATSSGDKKNIFIIRADGTVAGGSRGLFNGGALDAIMRPGDMIMVPNKAQGGGIKWRSTLEAAQLVSAVGIAVQVARGF
jgi:protein involved in polysaccharide export with SLBB domain